MALKARWWMLMCVLAGTAATVCAIAGLRRVFDTGHPAAGNLHYMFATILAGVLFVALAGVDHHETNATAAGEAEDEAQVEDEAQDDTPVGTAPAGTTPVGTTPAGTTPTANED